jgi:hypothetical protein
MEPGISAEACLYADLGIDPGRYGCQHHEASQFMFYRRRVDTSAYLVVWQAGVAGDRSHARMQTGSEYRQVLVDVLLESYPAKHPVTIYEAATLAIGSPTILQSELQSLAEQPLDLRATLVLPPAMPLQPNSAVIARLEELDRKRVHREQANQGEGSVDVERHSVA